LSSSVAAPDDDSGAREIRELLASLASNPILAELAIVPGLTKTQRADVAANRFVPLSSFSPTPGMGAAQAIASASITDPSLSDEADIFRQSLNNLMGESNPFLKAQQAQRVKDMTPRFKSFEQVIAAFFTGLVPLACYDDPIRFADYTTFMTAVMMDCARGNYHWPVYLKYIETIRKKAMLAGIPPSPTVDAQREAHRLCSSSLSDTSMLNEQVLMGLGQFWSNRNAATFEAEHVDPKTLADMFREAREGPKPPSPAQPPSSSSSGPSSTRSPKAPSKKSGGSLPFTDAEWAKLVALPGTPFCRNFVGGRCTMTDCRRPHKDASKIRAEYLGTGSH
jgi:hypothetical protein